MAEYVAVGAEVLDQLLPPEEEIHILPPSLLFIAARYCPVLSEVIRPQVATIDVWLQTAPPKNISNDSNASSRYGYDSNKPDVEIQIFPGDTVAARYCPEDDDVISTQR